ncbi:MAG: imidazolonepropionase [Anaerolineaceae bacterium]|nr:imidazolonepropionase [Anaerolineaceae bacterium]
MLIHSSSQLLTLAGGPQIGNRLGQLNIIHNGAVLIRDEKIADIGDSKALLKKYPAEPQLNANNCVLMPGFIDPHTHLVWAGDRAAEFEMRLEGMSYMEIMAAGGGIQTTVNATREASYDELFAQSEERALNLFRLGTTTAEAKSGYGFELKTELKQLKVALNLNKKGPLEVYPTFLGAHAVPSDFKENPDAYVDILCKEMLPAVKDWWGRTVEKQPLPFVDVFCEKGAFDVGQSRKILETAKKMGFPLKIHVDEFENIGGSSLAAELCAVSADHVVKTSQRDIAALADAKTVAVSLPCTPFGLAEDKYSPAKDMIKAGCIFALASDLNPGTAWCGNMQFAMALACRYMGLTPAQAIAASTINAAAAIGRQEYIGSIEIGKQADMILLSVSDYRNLPYRFGANLVSAVIKKGKAYLKEDLCQL